MQSLLVPAMQGSLRSHNSPHSVTESSNTPIYDDRYHESQGDVMDTLSLRRDLTRLENPPFGMWWTYTVEETLVWPILGYRGKREQLPRHDHGRFRL